MGIRNIEQLFPWDEVEPFPYPPVDTTPITPEPEPEPQPRFVVSDPDAGGYFTMSGSDSVVSVLSPTSYRLDTPLVTDNANGTFTATSE